MANASSSRPCIKRVSSEDEVLLYDWNGDARPHKLHYRCIDVASGYDQQFDILISRSTQEDTVAKNDGDGHTGDQVFIEIELQSIFGSWVLIACPEKIFAVRHHHQISHRPSSSMTLSSAAAQRRYPVFRACATDGVYQPVPASAPCVYAQSCVEP